MQIDVEDRELSRDEAGLERRTYLAEPFTISARLHHAFELAFDLHRNDPRFQREWSHTDGFADWSPFDLLTRMVESVSFNRTWLLAELKQDDEEAIELATAVMRMVTKAVQRVADAQEDASS